jgi:hypothetical protein
LGPCSGLIGDSFAALFVERANSIGQGTYFLFGSFCACTFFFAYFLIPETKGTYITFKASLPRLVSLLSLPHPCSLLYQGMSLEKMDELFGITEMLRVMQDMENNRHQGGARRPYSFRTTAEYELKGEDQWQRRSAGGNSAGSIS